MEAAPFFLIMAFFVLISLVSLGLMIWAIVDISRSEFPGQGKLIWILVVLFAGLVGIIVYMIVGRAQKIPPVQPGDAGKNPFGE